MTRRWLSSTRNETQLTGLPSVIVINQRTNTVRRPKPKGFELIKQATISVRQRSFTNVGYYSKPYGDGVYTGPVSEYVSSQGTIFTWNPTAEASLKLRAGIKAQNLNLAQSCAEYKQACTMFASFAKDIVSSYRAIRGGLPSLFSAAFSRLLQKRDPVALRAANRWLQYQYGVKPLMSDLYGVLDLFQAQMQAGSLYVSRVSGGCGLNKSRSSGDAIQIQSGTSKYVATAYFMVRNETLRSLAQNGITNPALLAWELIPYSFVIDWVLPIGNWLSAADALTGVTVLKAIMSRRDQWSIEAKYRDGSSITENEYSVRDLIPLDMPAYLPYKPSESFTAVLNGVALLTQIRGR